MSALSVFLLLIRGDYKEAYYQMPILFMGMLFSSMASFIGGIYVAHKKTRSVGVTTILAAACNLMIDLVFVHKIGIFAASISTLVSYVFLTIYRMVDVQKFQKVKFNTGRFCLLIALLVLMCAICWVDTVVLNILNIILGCQCHRPGCFYLLNRRKYKSFPCDPFSRSIHSGNGSSGLL